MALRYKISILATITMLIVLIPLSLFHIRSLARAEEKEIKGRLEDLGKLMATQLFISEMGPGSKERQIVFLKAAQKVDDDILFIAVQPGNKGEGIAVINREQFAVPIDGSEWELIRQFVEHQTDPSIHYISIKIPKNNQQLLLGYSIANIE